MKMYTTTIICWLELYMTGISSAGVSERETDFFLLLHLSLGKEKKKKSYPSNNR